jgi:hypothetical protein
LNPRKQNDPIGSAVLPTTPKSTTARPTPTQKDTASGDTFTKTKRKEKPTTMKYELTLRETEMTLTHLHELLNCQFIHANYGKSNRQSSEN